MSNMTYFYRLMEPFSMRLLDQFETASPPPALSSPKASTH